jgi:hypothetical protein
MNATTSEDGVVPLNWYQRRDVTAEGSQAHFHSMIKTGKEMLRLCLEALQKEPNWGI